MTVSSAYHMTNNLINIFSSDRFFSKTNSRGHPFKSINKFALNRLKIWKIGKGTNVHPVVHH